MDRRLLENAEGRSRPVFFKNEISVDDCSRWIEVSGSTSTYKWKKLRRSVLSRRESCSHLFKFAIELHC